MWPRVVPLPLRGVNTMRRSLKLTAAGIAAAAALALGAGVASAAPAAPACTVNCTAGSLTIGAVTGTSGFPTSFAMSGAAGSVATATATSYSVFSNQPWSLSFTTDPADGVPVPSSGGLVQADWTVLGPGGVPTAFFPLATSTTITHNGVVDHLPNSNGVLSVLIDSGQATAGGQAFADVFTTAIPATQAPGAYSAEFAYVLVAS